MSILGNTTKTASPRGKREKFNVKSDGESGLAKRYRLQDASRRLLPGERVGVCMRTPAYGTHKIDVHRQSDGKSAWFSGCMVCSSVWTCPICSERISQHRRDELQRALGEVHNNGLSVLMITYTVQHNKSDSCEDVLNTLSVALRRFKSGRWFQSVKGAVGLVGTIRNIEVLYGENGWHVHAHELWIVESGDIDILDDPLAEASEATLREELKAKWAEIVEKSGGWASQANGLDAKTGDASVYDYVAKFGRMPKSRPYEPNLASELATIRTKTGRSAGLTMWELLDMADRGNKQAGHLFTQYAFAFKGKRQLVWSRGLKSLLNIVDIADEDIEPTESEVVASIPLPAWLKICQYHMRDVVLECAKNNEIDRINALILAYS